MGHGNPDALASGESQDPKDNVLTQHVEKTSYMSDM
jgi:hypothetical protein